MMISAVCYQKLTSLTTKTLSFFRQNGAFELSQRLGVIVLRGSNKLF